MIPRDQGVLRPFLWTILGLLLTWSGWAPKDRLTWWMEVMPIFIGAALLVGMRAKFRFSLFVLVLLWLHSIVLLVGGHYTYAEVPLFNWIRDALGLSRNHYDRVGHFMQGFVPALVAREVLIRRGVLKRGPWLNFLVVCVCLAISAVYELLEWQAAVWTGAKADAFLGTQGDPWDTQKDMAMAWVGAMTALAFFHKPHDSSMEKRV